MALVWAPRGAAILSGLVRLYILYHIIIRIFIGAHLGYVTFLSLSYRDLCLCWSMYWKLPLGIWACFINWWFKCPYLTSLDLSLMHLPRCQYLPTTTLKVPKELKQPAGTRILYPAWHTFLLLFTTTSSSKKAGVTHVSRKSDIGSSFALFWLGLYLHLLVRLWCFILAIITCALTLCSYSWLPNL